MVAELKLKPDTDKLPRALGVRGIFQPTMWRTKVGSVQATKGELQMLPFRFRLWIVLCLFPTFA